MKRLSFMVSMAMLISCVASCDSGSDAVSYGVGTLSLGLSANPSFFHENPFRQRSGI